MYPRDAPVVGTFNTALNHDLFSRFVLIHLLFAGMAVTALLAAPSKGEQTVYLVGVALASVPTVLGLLARAALIDRMVQVWAVTAATVVALLIWLGSADGMLVTALVYGALGPLPPQWRLRQQLLPAAVAGAALWLRPDPIPGGLVFWAMLLSFLLSTFSMRRREHHWSQLRLAHQHERAPDNGGQGAAAPTLAASNARQAIHALDEADAALEALALAVSPTVRSQVVRTNQLVSTARMAIAGAARRNVTVGHQRVPLGPLLEQAWRDAMERTHAPLMLRHDIPAQLTVYTRPGPLRALLTEVVALLALAEDARHPTPLDVDARRDSSRLFIDLHAPGAELVSAETRAAVDSLARRIPAVATWSLDGVELMMEITTPEVGLVASLP